MRVALQLYTVRDLTLTPDGLYHVLKKAKEIGYEGAQFSAVGCMNGDSPLTTAREARQMLEEFGLECCATHRPWERFQNNLAEEVLFHHELGCKYAAIGMPPKFVQESGSDGWQAFVARVNQVSQELEAEGIHFGYHNHAFEFQRLEDSSRPFDLLMERTDPSVFFILDTYWVMHAGVDVVSLIQKLKGRLPVVHLKDKAVFGWETDFAPVGEGNLGWDVILPAFEEAGTDWLVVEQDTCRRDVWDCVQSSFDYVSQMLKP